MRARVKTQAYGPHLLDREYPVVGIEKVKGRTFYELETIPEHWKQPTRILTFCAAEVTLIKEAS